MFDTTTTANAVHSAFGSTEMKTAAAIITKAVDFDEVRQRNAVLGVIEMPWSEWEALNKHPNQRFTARHAAQLAASKVLVTPLDLHRNVAAVVVGNIDHLREQFRFHGGAILAGDNAFKLDGHSRTMAQKEGHAPKPETVLVTIHAAVDAAESARLYAAFDSSVSSKKGGDKGQSALISAGIEPTSSIFQSAGGIIMALRIAEAIIDEGTVVPKPVNKRILSDDATVAEALEAIVPALTQAKRFKHELKFLDGLNLASKVMPVNSSAMAAYIAMLVSNSDKACEFLNACRLSKGVSEGGKADAVFVACHARDQLVLKKSKLRGTARIEYEVAVLLNAFQGYQDGTTFDANRYPSHTGVIASLFDKERRAAVKAAIS